MTPGNGGDVGKDQAGNSDGSWWGTNSSANDQGGEHHTQYNESGRISFDTDSSGNYIPGSGHTVDSSGKTASWD